MPVVAVFVCRTDTVVDVMRKPNLIGEPYLGRSGPKTLRFNSLNRRTKITTALFIEARRALDPLVLVSDQRFRELLQKFLDLNELKPNPLGTDLVAKARSSFTMSQYANQGDLYADMRSTLRHCANEIEKKDLTIIHLEGEVSKLEETLQRGSLK